MPCAFPRHSIFALSLPHFTANLEQLWCNCKNDTKIAEYVFTTVHIQRCRWLNLAAYNLKPKHIITHPGGAHKDEFLACCLLIAKHELVVYRQEPSQADLEDAAIFVIDVGHRHDPDKLNFDHHQFPGDHPPTCSLSLVLQYLGLYEDAQQFCAWLEPAEWLDCRGPRSTAKWMGVAPEVIQQLVSPMDVSLLKRFAAQEKLMPGDLLWEMMRCIGQDVLDYLTQLRTRLAFIQKHASVWEVTHSTGNHQVLFMPRTDPLPEEPSSGLGFYIEQLGLDHAIIGMIYPDRRHTGYALARFQDSPTLDFTQIEHEADVHFAHARGFIAKTSATDEARLRQLLATAVRVEA